ncbi:MAG: CBS domain-containing protein [Sphingobacteriales bacterium]|jgi:acetoin utilization protein AcuB|nr:MAG: CBS domain-containing protein [Sphingobacteriales bacterium]
MIALDLIANIITPLKPTDTVAWASSLMLDFKTNHLPVVSPDLTFLGLVSDDDLIEAKPQDTLHTIALSSYANFVYQQQHIYDVIRTVYEQNLSIIPVLDDSKKYQGLITLNTLVQNMASLQSSSQAGAIIVLELGPHDNSLAFIAQIIEAQDTQILSTYTRHIPQSTQTELTIKVNKTDVGQILVAFTRYKIDVKAIFNHQDKYNNVTDRYQSLINYLSF